MEKDSWAILLEGNGFWRSWSCKFTWYRMGCHTRPPLFADIYHNYNVYLSHRSSSAQPANRWIQNRSERGLSCTQFPSSRRWYHIGMDFIGSISPASEMGNCYILTISDYFTKYAWVKALSTKEAAGVVSAMREVRLFIIIILYIP